MGPRGGRGPIARAEKRACAPAGSVRASLLALVVTVIGTLALTGTGAAATSCGEAVLDDWFNNGRVDVAYELPCYGEAIDAIPSDIRDYSDAEEVISRALRAATRGRLAEGGVDPTPSVVLRHESSRASVTDSRESDVVRAATAATATSGASSIPIPLVVLGGFSLALLAAGGFSRLSSRQRGGEDSDEEGHI